MTKQKGFYFLLDAKPYVSLYHIYQSEFSQYLTPEQLQHNYQILMSHILERIIDAGNLAKTSQEFLFHSDVVFDQIHFPIIPDSISKVALYDTALSADTIQAHYEASLKNKDQNHPIYTLFIEEMRNFMNEVCIMFYYQLLRLNLLDNDKKIPVGVYLVEIQLTYFVLGYNDGTPFPVIPNGATYG